MITVELQKCKNCGHILEFGTTETCPFCQNKNEE